MRLSDAIALGRTMVTRCRRGGSDGFNAEPGDGCILDMAVLSVLGEGHGWMEAKYVWPWLTIAPEKTFNFIYQGEKDASYEVIIVMTFDEMIMTHGSMTLDQLIDWIRSVEPQEDEQVLNAGSVRPEKFVVTGQEVGLQSR